MHSSPDLYAVTLRNYCIDVAKSNSTSYNQSINSKYSPVVKAQCADFQKILMFLKVEAIIYFIDH